MVLLIDNYDSFTYNLVQRLGEIDPELHLEVRRNDQITLDEIAAMQPERIIISPGPCTPSEAGISVDCIRRFAAHDHPHERRLTGAVGSNDADDPSWRQPKVQVIEKDNVAIGFGDVIRLDDHVAQSWTRWDLNYQLVRAISLLLGRHRVVSADACLALGLAGLGGHADPLQLPLERLLPRGRLLLLDLQPPFLLLQP